MPISRPNGKEPSPEEQQDLDKLQAIIDQAVADGKITEDEIAAMKSQAWADGKITSQELELFSKRVMEKLRNGELEWEL